MTTGLFATFPLAVGHELHLQLGRTRHGHAAGAGSHQGYLEQILEPKQVGDLIDESRRAERTRRGVYMMNA